MPTHKFSPKRALWKRAVLSASMVTLAAMASLFGAKYFKIQFTTLSSRMAVADASSDNDPAIESLSKRVAADNEEHQALQSKRTALASSLQQMPALIWTPAEHKRRQLASQLIRLLALEKQYSEDSPEITATRQQIDDLQSEIAEMPPTEIRLQTMTPSVRVPYETQLADTDHRISLNEAQTSADVSQLGQLVRAKDLSALQRHSRNALAVPVMALISVLLGLFAGLLVVIFVRLSRVRQEAPLLRLLPSKVELLGTIPHMQEQP